MGAKVNHGKPLPADEGLDKRALEVNALVALFPYVAAATALMRTVKALAREGGRDE